MSPEPAGGGSGSGAGPSRRTPLRYAKGEGAEGRGNGSKGSSELPGRFETQKNQAVYFTWLGRNSDALLTVH
jgi:hypothetical protein